MAEATTTKRKHEAMADESDQRFAALQPAVLGGFKEDSLTDFRIVCQDRTFFVHKIVLVSLPYFKAMVFGPWTESASNMLTVEDATSTTLEHVLAFLYGADYVRDISPKCRPRKKRGQETASFYPSQNQKDAASHTHAELVRPTVDSLKYVKSSRKELSDLAKNKITQDPPPPLSTRICEEVLEHLKIWIQADKYDCQKLKKAAEERVTGLLCDCWNSPTILQIAETVYSDYHSQNHVLRKAIQAGFAARFSIFRDNERFRALLHRSPVFSQALMLGLLEQPRLELQGMVFCSYYTCRQNYQQLTPRSKKCPSCDQTTTAERREPQWQDE